MRSLIERIISELASQKELPEEVVEEAFRKSVKLAYRKEFSSEEGVEVEYDKEEAGFKVFAVKKVVKRVKDKDQEINITKARQLDKDIKVGDEIKIDVTPDEFGRIAVQTARQVLLQQLKEAEREYIYKDYFEKKTEIVQGTIIRKQAGTCYVDLGKVEGIFPVKEQIPTEEYRVGYRIRGMILDVVQTDQKPQIILTRASGKFVKRLFELEVPEVFQGTVTIEAIARDPGVRTKIAVQSHEEEIDPVGSCVGRRGVRIKSIQRELRSEKIDIVPYSEDLVEFIKNALSPAEILRVELDPSQQSALVVVNNDQLPLAIGTGGQNVRLASRLVGLELDVRNVEEAAEILEELAQQDGGEEELIEELEVAEEEKEDVVLEEIEGIGDKLASILRDIGIENASDLAEADIKTLKSIKGVSENKAQNLKKEAGEKVLPGHEIGLEEMESLNNRILSSLKEEGIKTVQSLASLSEEELLKIKGVGEKTVLKIKKELASLEL